MLNRDLNVRGLVVDALTIIVLLAVAFFAMQWMFSFLVGMVKTLVYTFVGVLALGVIGVGLWKLR